MLWIGIVFMLLATGTESLDCPATQHPCGTVGCYDPAVQECSNDGRIIRCINSCNGTCYSNNQYCYNNTIICNNGESVCDVKNYNYFAPFPNNLTCYNASQLICHNNTLCSSQYSCGGRCLTDENSVCADNETICSGFSSANYHPDSNRSVKTCGPQKICYDNSTHVCLNGSTVCSGLNARLCGSMCYNPELQRCTNGVVRCIRSCNGICFSTEKYCFNNTKICNKTELVCDVKNYNYFSNFPYNLTCYNASQFICRNNTLCYRQYACGGQCLTDSNSVCANNRTICLGFSHWDYFPYTNRFLRTCGPDQICYDNSTHVCRNGSILCPGLNARLCGSICYNPEIQRCTNGILRCIYSCSGTCYSNNQYCYNNTIICNNGESVCDVKNYNYFAPFPNNLTCYNTSQLICHNNTLCSSQYSCGGRCLTDENSVCADNETICSGFSSSNYHPDSNRSVKTCGPQKICYDNSTYVCADDNGTVCPIGNQLCSGICYDPELRYCVGGNNTIFCLNNPLSSSCALITTATIPGESSTMPITLGDSSSWVMSDKSSTIPINPVESSAWITSNESPTPMIPGDISTGTTFEEPFTSISPTTPLPVCDIIQNCTQNSDCCRPGPVECQCFRHNHSDLYGACIDPNVTPICGDHCPVKSRCRYDSDCCKNQCAETSFTDADGQITIKKLCIPR